MFNPTFEGKDPPIRLLAEFHKVFPDLAPEHILQVEGREMWVAAVTSDMTDYTIHAPDSSGKVVFNWRTAKNKRTLLNRPLPKWARYPAGVVFALGKAGLNVKGVCAVIISEEPSGPRYEYALALTIAALWHELTEADYTTESLLEVVDQVRREYIGE